MAKLTFEQFQKKVQNFARNSPEAVEEALAAGGEMVRGEAQVEHFGTSRTAGGGFSGERLMNQSHTLRQSITTRVKANKLQQSATVGTNVTYAATHEYGRGKIPRRPFLRPSLEEKRKDVLELILRKLMEAYRRAL